MKSPTGEDPSGFINLIDNWEEECCRSISNSLGRRSGRSMSMFYH